MQRTPGHILALSLLLLGAGMAAPATLAAQSARAALTGLTPVLPADAKDLGPAAAATPVRRIQMVLARSPAQEAALGTLLDQQQDRTSANYAHWLTPREFGARFGPSDGELGALTAWLAAQGFHEIAINRGRTVIEFSGTAATVAAAFEAAPHTVSVGGQTRYANRSDPTIPAGFAGLVKGIASLNNLASPPAAAAHPEWTLGSNGTTYYPVTPYDFATIYDVLPLWNAGVDGTGQSIAIVGDTDIDPADFVNFRKLFSLPLGNVTSQTGTQYLNIIYNGPKPTVRTDESHADSDTQWAAAVARGATIDYVASEATEASSGNDLSAAYIVDNNLAAILVDSYATCELTLGTGENAFYTALWQQAAAQGITVVAAAGDSGAAGCDGAHVSPAAQGAAVSGVGSTAYNVSVGGTDWVAPNGLGSYFSVTNAASFASATGYIPETVWNDSCTNPSILSQAPYAGLTAEQACNSAAAKAANLAVAAGSGGGASACTASNGSNPQSCSGGNAKPVWQAAPGVPADDRRDTPDVALFASQGRANSFYVVCQQSRDTDGQPCNLSYPWSDFAGYGGTELAAPAFAGIMAMAAQKNGARLGNPNYTLYGLARLQAGTNCNATASPSASCIFHDVTTGTNAMPCVTGSLNCVTATAGDAYGVMAGNAAAAGYDLASGLGSVDAANLVNAWASVTFHPTQAVLSVYPSQVAHGAPVTASVSVTGQTPTGEVSIDAQAAAGSVGAGALSGGLYSQTFRNLPGGSYGVDAHYSGDAANAPTDSNFVAVTVLPESSSTTLQTLAYNPTTGVAKNVSSAPYGNIYYLRSNVSGASGEGIATGNVAITDNGVIFGSGVYRLNSSGYTEAQNNAISPGTHVFAAAYAGDPSFNPSAAPSATLTITKSSTFAAVASTAQTVSIASVVTLSAVVGTQSFGFAAPSGTATFYLGTQAIGTSTLVAGADPATGYRNATATLTLSAAAFPIGSALLTVAFAGDANYVASLSPAAPLLVTGTTLQPTSTSVTALPVTVTPLGTIAFAAQVALVGGQSAALGGTLQFVVDGQNFGAAISLSATGTASVTSAVTPWTVGAHSVVAVYSGDAVNFRSSASLPAPFLIATPGVTSIPVFTANPATAVQGTFISVAANILPSSPVATGTVQLVLDGGPYGAAIPLTEAAATLPLVTSTLQAGQHILTVYYAGDATFASAYALPATLTIDAPGVTPSAVAISNLTAQVVPGTDVAFSAAVSPTKPAPTGILQVIFDGGNPGSPILLAGSSTALSLPAASLTLGVHTVRVFYSGDATYNFSASAVSSITVAPPSPLATFTLTPGSQTFSVKSGTAGAESIVYTVTAQNGFSAPVVFACVGLPAYTSCGFSPATVSLAGVPSASSTLTLTLSTGLHGATDIPPRPGERSGLPLVFAGCVGGLLCLRRRRLRAMLTGLLAAVALAGLTSCDSGYVFGSSPAGTYTIGVTATGGGVSQTATVDLVVR